MRRERGKEIDVRVYNISQLREIETIDSFEEKIRKKNVARHFTSGNS